jgi:hypothetical protein
MQTFIDRYIEQGRQEGGAALLLRQIERKFGAPSAAMRERISNAGTACAADRLRLACGAMDDGPGMIAKNYWLWSRLEAGSRPTQRYDD